MKRRQIQKSQEIVLEDNSYTDIIFNNSDIYFYKDSMRLENITFKNCNIKASRPSLLLYGKKIRFENCHLHLEVMMFEIDSEELFEIMNKEKSIIPSIEFINCTSNKKIICWGRGCTMIKVNKNLFDIFDMTDFPISVVPNRYHPLFYIPGTELGKEIIGYKVIREKIGANSTSKWYLVKLKVFKSTPRVSCITRPDTVRAAKVRILDIIDSYGNHYDQVLAKPLYYVAPGGHMYINGNENVLYKVGYNTVADMLDKNIRHSCTHGIHFYLKSDLPIKRFVDNDFDRKRLRNQIKNLIKTN